MNPVIEAAEQAVKGPATVVRLHAAMIGSAVVLAVVVGCYVYHKAIVTGLKLQIKTLTEENSQLTRDNATLKGNVVTLSDAVAKQNKKVKALADEQDEMSKVANAAIAKAKANAAQWKKKYDAVLDAPRPPGDDCAAFNTKLDQYIEMRREETQ